MARKINFMWDIEKVKKNIWKYGENFYLYMQILKR